MLRTLLLVSMIALAWGAPPASAQSTDLQKKFPWFAKEAGTPEYPAILVSSEWLAQRITGAEAVPVDVRPRARYEAGHLPGAVSFETPLVGLEGGETLVLYGSDGDWQVMGKAFLALTAAGWPEVQVLDVTYEQWVASGLPVATSGGERHPVPRGSSSAVSAFVTREELRGGFGRAGFEVLDLRGGWGEGYEAPAAFAAGHVPHALPLDVGRLFPLKGWPAPEKIREVVGALGARAADRVDPEAVFLLYGEGPQDPRLGLGFLLLRMAGFSVRVFPGGFSDWVADPQSPVIRLLEAQDLKDMLIREQRVEGQEKDARLADRAPQSFVLFDLREDWDYDDEHIPGAYSLPELRFSDELSASLRERWPEADPRTTPLVFYCYGRECIRSRNCATWAAQKGFLKLFWLREGMEGWSGIDGQVFETPTAEAPSSQSRRGRPYGQP
jgi:thiosulfate/3-mercaptopyruvate sulfurtransferase